MNDLIPSRRRNNPLHTAVKWRYWGVIITLLLCYYAYRNVYLYDNILMVSSSSFKDNQETDLDYINIKTNRNITHDNIDGRRIILTDNPDREITYVHIGKTGGTTLEKVLVATCALLGRQSRRKECKDNINASGESLLSTKISMALHWPLIIPPVFNVNTTTFLFTVRNPISRLVSAFNMQHPSNTLTKNNNNCANYFYSCFPTIQHLADTLQNHDKGLSVMNVNNESVNCFQLGKDTLTGRPSQQPCADYAKTRRYKKQTYFYETYAGLACGHCYGNYEKYTKYTLQKYPDKEVFAIRTEQLWNDTHNLNVALGGRENAFEHITNHRHTHGSEAYQVSTGLTKLGKATICCFIYEEIPLYEKIIKRAVNLLEAEKNETLASLYEDCGITNRDDGNFTWTAWAETHKCL